MKMTRGTYREYIEELENKCIALEKQVKELQSQPTVWDNRELDAIISDYRNVREIFPDVQSKVSYNRLSPQKSVNFIEQYKQYRRQMKNFVSSNSGTEINENIMMLIRKL